MAEAGEEVEESEERKSITPALGLTTRSSRKTIPEILAISLRMEQFISDNRWNWCDMSQVYRVLKALHE